MNDFNFLGTKEQWDLLKWLGVYHPLLKVTIPTLVATWFVICFIIATLLICRMFLSSEKSIVRHAILQAVESFMDLCNQSLGKFHYGHFSFITALFIFILYCNLMGVLPFLEEPTADLNTTVALGTISFLYINYYGVWVKGSFAQSLLPLLPPPPLVESVGIGVTSSILPILRPFLARALMAD